MTKQISNPNLADLLYQAQLDVFAKLNCHRIGIIQEFDSVKFTAKIKLVDKLVNQTIGGKVLYDLPILVDVPVFMPIQVDKGFTYPIIVGETECVVMFNDRDIDKWYSNGQPQEQNSMRMHSLSDGLALIGFRSLLRPVTSYNINATEMRYINSKISMTNTLINIKNGSSAEIDLQEKIKIKNSAQSLKTVIDNFINIISNLKTVDPISGELPIDAATASALISLSANVAALLDS